MPRILLLISITIATAGIAYGQRPNLDAQREAMKKLDFLAGKWSGEATVSRGGAPVKVHQTEEIQYKLDGLVLLIEGTARGDDGQIAFQALATVAYDDHTSTYRFRAYNQGAYVDTELSVKPKGFAWGYAAGPVKMNNTMELNEKGAWVEVTEIVLGTAAPQKVVEMNLTKQ